MNDFGTIAQEISAWTAPQQIGRLMLVPTFNMYPSNAAVQVQIEGGVENFVVSDGGGALEAMHKAGEFTGNSTAVMRSLAHRYGLKVDSGGRIYAANVSRDEITSYIALVADCSKQAAEALVRRMKARAVPDFRPQVERWLIAHFHESFSSAARWAGASNKTHRFDYSIRVGPDVVALIDAVVPDPNSVNAAVVAHMDVRSLGNPAIRQGIVYDDADEWSSADLALLAGGAQPIPFSRIGQGVARFGQHV